MCGRFGVKPWHLDLLTGLFKTVPVLPDVGIYSFMIGFALLTIGVYSAVLIQTGP
jgi:hypothetical protein